MEEDSCFGFWPGADVHLKVDCLRGCDCQLQTLPEDDSMVLFAATRDPGLFSPPLAWQTELNVTLTSGELLVDFRCLELWCQACYYFSCAAIDQRDYGAEIAAVINEGEGLAFFSMMIALALALALTICICRRILEPKLGSKAFNKPKPRPQIEFVEGP